MNEIKEDGASFIGYEYKELPACGERASLYLDGYQNFGWVLDERTGEEAIVFDAAQAGVGDVVLVTTNGSAASQLLGDRVIADMTICGVVDSVSLDGTVRNYL